MKRFQFGMAFAVLVAVSADTARGSLITSTSDISSPSSTLDFSQFANLGLNTNSGIPGFETATGPLSVGDNVTLTSNDSNAIIGNGTVLLGGNGQFDTGRNGFVSLNDTAGNLTFTFQNPVSQVGALLNYIPELGGLGADATIAALGSTGSILESYDIFTQAPISTPNGTDVGGFRGISRSSADIFGFQVSNQFAVVDDLTFFPAAAAVPVPEPGTLSLLGISLLGMFGYGWQRRRR